MKLDRESTCAKITQVQTEGIIQEARDLWSFYESGYMELGVRHAIAEGIILKNEISTGILEKL